MCLYVRPNEKSNIAEEDIEVFKVLYVINAKMISPFHYYYYEIGKPYTSILVQKLSSTAADIYSKEIKKLLTIMHPEYTDDTDIGIIEDGLHTFESYKDANDFKNTLHGTVVVRCVIPKGSQYYKGGWLHNVVAYASDTLTLVEIL